MLKTGLNIISIFLLLLAVMGVSATLDLNNLFNYSNQAVPVYITKDNTSSNSITDEGATLGRVLFYDKKLSSDKTVSCASCHIQEFAFSDTAIVSEGVNGPTLRHSTRLVNNRFGSEAKFFWDERADSLEEQATMPIHDHNEMGFSGTNGDPDIDDLMQRLDSIDYYDQLFALAFGDTNITEIRIQFALAQFMRSIQSFDSKFDVGYALTGDYTVDFPNFTAQENLGKFLFLSSPFNGGANCATCHNPPEFDIDPFSKNNGVIAIANGTPGIDTTNTRSPSLRDLVNNNGEINGPFMHTGSFPNLMSVIDHYDSIEVHPLNTNIDQRLLEGGEGQDLDLSINEKNALIDFLLTLTGSDLYTNEKWSDPFDSNGNLNVVGGNLGTFDYNELRSLMAYPNPFVDQLTLVGNFAFTRLDIFQTNGQIVASYLPQANKITINVSGLASGIYIVKMIDSQTAKQLGQTKVYKQ